MRKKRENEKKWGSPRTDGGAVESDENVPLQLLRIQERTQVLKKSLEY